MSPVNSKKSNSIFSPTTKYFTKNTKYSLTNSPINNEIKKF